MLSFPINFIITEMSRTALLIIIFSLSGEISVIIATVVGYFGFKEKFLVKKQSGLLRGLCP